MTKKEENCEVYHAIIEISFLLYSFSHLLPSGFIFTQWYYVFCNTCALALWITECMERCLHIWKLLHKAFKIFTVYCIAKLLCRSWYVTLTLIIHKNNLSSTHITWHDILRRNRLVDVPFWTGSVIVFSILTFQPVQIADRLRSGTYNWSKQVQTLPQYLLASVVCFALKMIRDMYRSKHQY